MKLCENSKSVLEYLRSIGFITVTRARLVSILDEVENVYGGVFTDLEIDSVKKRFFGCDSVTLGLCYHPSNVDLLSICAFAINMLHYPSIFCHAVIDIGLDESVTDNRIRGCRFKDKGVIKVNKEYIYQKDSLVGMDDKNVYVCMPHTEPSTIGIICYGYSKDYLKESRQTYLKYNPFDAYNIAPLPREVKSKIDSGEI